jgi:hypothetical protein
MVVMALEKNINLEPIYVVGSHEDFVTAIGDKPTELMDRQPAGAALNVTNVSHAVASHDGELHWSAFVTAEITTRT